jgi:predicted flap endonuclease-1-like 5' DNA nuclease
LSSLSNVAQQAQPTGGGIVFTLVMLILLAVVLVLVWYALKGKRISRELTGEQAPSPEPREDAAPATPPAALGEAKLLPPSTEAVPAQGGMATDVASPEADVVAPAPPAGDLQQIEEIAAAPATEPDETEAAVVSSEAVAEVATPPAAVDESSNGREAAPATTEESQDAAPTPEAAPVTTASATEDAEAVAVATPPAGVVPATLENTGAVPASPAVADDVVTGPPAAVDEAPALEPAGPAEAPVETRAPEAESATAEAAPTEEIEAVATLTPVDDLKQVEGIGRKIASVLAEGGITSFAQLAAMTPDQIRSMLEGKVRLAAPDTWPEQASLAAQGKWDELKEYQSQLKGGRRV